MDSTFDYTLVIEFERLAISEMKAVLQYLYHSSSECYGDIESLADEVIYRLDDCQCNIREREYKELNQLIVSTFETLKSISKFMEKPSARIYIIHEKYHKYMHGSESPTVSPVASPKILGKLKAPKIMKKAKREKR